MFSFSCFSRVLFVIGFSIFLSACGGGGGSGGSSSPPPTAPITLKGVVLSDVPLSGITITVWSAGATSTSCEAITDAQGRYSATCADMKPPYLIFADQPYRPGSYLLYPGLASIALGQGTVNVTPLTTLLVSQLLGALTVNQEGGLGQALVSVSAAQIETAQQAVVDYLKKRPARWDPNIINPIDVSMISDFVTTPLSASAGDPYFDAVSRLTASLMPGENISAIEEDMLNGSLPPADLNNLMTFTDVGINCDSAPNPTNAPVPGLPAGDAKLSVDAAGDLHIGTYSMNYGPLSLVVESGSSFPNRWELDSAAVSPATGNYAPGFRINFEAGVFSSVWLNTLHETSTCHPTTPSAKKMQPTRFELVRSAAFAISQHPNNTVNCGSAPSIPGFQTGNNLVFIDSRGELVVNSYLENNGLTRSLLSGLVGISATNISTTASPSIYVSYLWTSDDINHTAINIQLQADGKIMSLQYIDQQGGITCSN